MLKHFIVLTTLLALGLTLVFRPVLAQEEATDSASVEQIQKNVQDRIKKALDENLDQAQQTVDEAKNRAVVGVVESLSTNQITITVNPDKGTAQYRHQATYDSNTDISKAGKTLKPDDIEIGSYVIAIGIPSSDSSLTATRIILDSYTKPSIYTSVHYATITDIDTKKDTLTLSNSTSDLDDPIAVTTKTDLFSPQQDELDISDLEENQKVVVVITINTTKETVTLNTLIAFPITDEPTATSSPSPNTTGKNTCGDGICQNVACFGDDCPTPESPETCPADCTEE